MLATIPDTAHDCPSSPLAAAPAGQEPEPVVTLTVLTFLGLLACLTMPAPKRRQPPSKYRQQRRAKILAVLDTEQPKIGKQVAREAALSNDSQLRADLSFLISEGRVARMNGSWGYIRVITTEKA